MSIKILFVSMLSLLFSIGSVEAIQPKQDLTITVHGFSGVIKEKFEELVNDFTNSTGIHVELASEGDYTQAFKKALEDSEHKNSVADIYHVSEYGSPTIIAAMQRDKSFIPVGELDPSFNKIKFLGGLELYYGSSDQTLLYALPFNPSMGIIYYNEQVFKDAGIEFKPATTWQEIVELGYQLKKAERSCFTFPWTAAYTYEYFCAIHDRPLATKQNGFQGADVKMVLDKDPKVIAFFDQLFQLNKAGIFHYESDYSGVVEEYFVKGQCGMLMQGSGRLGTIQKAMADRNTNFTITYGPIPYDSKITSKPKVPKIGGGAFWATNEKASVIKFLQYIIKPEVQAKWTRLTGYMPSTEEAHQILVQEGYYANNPHVLIAVNQVRQREFTINTHLRLGKYDEIRGQIFNTLFKAYLAKENPKAKEFLKEFCQQANQKLQAFRQEYEKAPKLTT